MINLPYDIAPEENPLDELEDVAQLKDDWNVTRISDNISFVELVHKNQRYIIYLEWQDDFASIQLEAVIDLSILDTQKDTAAHTLMEINNNTWLGHFNISDDEKSQPVFRHSLLLRNIPGIVGAEMILQTIDIAVNECDRFYPIFKMLVQGNTHMHDLLSATIMKTAGEA